MKVTTVLIFIMMLTIPLVTFGQSIITLGISSQEHPLGQPVIVQGIVNLSPNDPKGLKISVELYDSNGNVVEAKTLPVVNNAFTYAIATGEGTKVTGNGKFTIIAYYGSPNPMLLNTPQSTRISFTIVGASTTVGQLNPTLPKKAQTSQTSENNSTDQNNLWWIGVGIVILAIIVGIVKSQGRSGSAIQRAMPRMSFSESVKEEVLRRQNHRCKHCKRLLTIMDFDHIDGDRSNNDIDNCQALCPTCHAEKSRRQQMGV